jgi:proteasome lid subunit RPN8/RPN11
MVRISRSAAAVIVAHARRDAPSECCGLLLGTADLILESIPARNTAADPARRYTIDPADHFAAIRRARELGIDVVGAYHSHPAGEPTPSETDQAEAFADFLFVIVGLARQPELAAWRYREEGVGGNFGRVPLVPIPVGEGLP